jgi:hypothetical protein
MGSIGEVEKEEEREEQEEDEILPPWTVGVDHYGNLRLLHIMILVARYVSTHYSPLLLLVPLLLLLLLQLLLLLLLPFLGVERGILGTERDQTLPSLPLPAERRVQRSRHENAGLTAYFALFYCSAVLEQRPVRYIPVQYTVLLLDIVSYAFRLVDAVRVT